MRGSRLSATGEMCITCVIFLSSIYICSYRQTSFSQSAAAAAVPEAAGATAQAPLKGDAVAKVSTKAKAGKGEIVCKQSLEQGESVVAEISDVKPGNIHDERYQAFWKELNPGAWVSSVLAEGYRIPLSTRIEAYKEANNASALSNMNFVREHV